MKNELPKNIYMPMRIDSIRFGNRFIKLGPLCGWNSVRNIQCPRLGQMDWSEFRDGARAEEYIAQRMKIVEEKRMGKLLNKELVPVRFEGVATTAQKFTLKIKLPKLVLGGSNQLYIYYVVAKVKEKYIACVLSHYDNDRNAPGLPPLISEVLTLK
ncbi:MAG: hypothetical protein AAGD05_08455 [Bacteroidota bacterium]